MKRETYRVVTVMLATLLSAPLSAQTNRFDVRSAIEMPEIVPIDGQLWGSTFSLRSPDGSKLLTRVRRGSVDENLLYDSLVLLCDPNATPEGVSCEPRQLVQFGYRQEIRSISRVRWIDNQQLAFIASRDDRPSQVYLFDIQSGELSQVTTSPSDVLNFDIANGQVLFYAWDPDLPDRVRDLGDQSAYDLLGLYDSVAVSSKIVSLYTQTVGQGSAPRRIGPRVNRYFGYQDISMSPSGRYGVVMFPSFDAPAEWRLRHYAGYEELGSEERPWPSATSMELFNKSRYYLVDVAAGSVRPLLDAPIGTPVNFSDIQVLWNERRNSVIVSNTYVPPNALQRVRLPDAANATATVEVDLTSGVTRVIVFDPEPQRSTISSPPYDRRQMAGVVALRWAGDRLEVTRQAGDITRQVGTDRRTIQTFLRNADSWRGGEVRLATSGELAPYLFQSINERPRLRIHVNGCDCEQTIYDPAPETDRFTLGQAEERSWDDGNGHIWHGVLLKPVGYIPGRRYPLVVQTHGGRPNYFLLNGDRLATAGMAARPLANFGFMVLQVADSGDVGDSTEADRYADGYMAGIRLLDNEGLVDPTKVGIVGFSRTGLGVLRFLSKYPQAARAAVVTDAAWWTYTHDIMGENTDTLSPARVVQAGDPQADFGRWFAQNPVYNIGARGAAVRFDAVGAARFTQTWEALVAIRRSGGTADLTWYPRGAHNPFTPEERMHSQGGAVDWFRFWLKGEEDSDPSKAQQYERWRRLRAQREAALARP